VLSGWVAPERTALARFEDLSGVEWRLGVPAAALDRRHKEVVLEDGTRLGYDKVLIATGTRNRAWPIAEQAALEGVCGIRTSEDARRLRDLLDQKPRRVVVIGAGFTGSEVASICRQRGLEVTVVERGDGPLVGALGGVISEAAAQRHRAAGVDLRCGVTVEGLEGKDGQLTAVALADGSIIEASVAVVALGAVRNTEWLTDSGLAAGALGISTDAGCRVIAVNGLVTDDVFAAGDVARFPHPLFGYQFLALEHWENAVVGARIAAHNMICAEKDRRAHLCVPTFWSVQFEVNIKSVGVPSLGHQVVITQGSVKDHRFAAAYGDHDGRIVAAITFNQGRFLDHYRDLIEHSAPLPEPSADAAGSTPEPARFPHPSIPYHAPTVIVTGHSPTDMNAVRVPPGGSTP
jgi:NADPH-dependent 2,4-dienoyl-CoA reductase/sulfur reductase-like enzyme